MQYQQIMTQAEYAALVVRLISAFEGHELRATDIGDGKATMKAGVRPYV
jgi:hypothetical protein